MRERKLFAGARLKRLRRELKLTQVRMADELGVSASYLNLMERNQRPITAQVLIRLVETYDLDLGLFSAEPDKRTFLALREAVSDPVLVSLGFDDNDIKELTEVHPLGAQALVRLHRAYRNLSHAYAGLSEQVSDEPTTDGAGQRPEDVVREMVHECEGYFPEIEEAAELFCAEIRMDRNTMYRELVARLQQLHSIRTRIMPDDVMRSQQRRYDRHSRRLLLSELLSGPERCVQLAIQIAHLELRDLLDEKCLDQRLQAAGPQAEELYRATLARCFAMAVILPYGQMRQKAQSCQYDLARLAAYFNTSIEMVARRLASLRRPGDQGLAMFFLRMDRAGNVIERGGSKSFGLSRYGGTCPKWKIWRAFGSNEPQLNFVEMADGEKFLSVAFAERRVDPGTFSLGYSQLIVIGCATDRAAETVYGKALGETGELHPQLIGASCRLCERSQCAQRSAPALLLGDSNRGTGADLLGSGWNGET